MNAVHPVFVILEQAREVDLLARELRCKAGAMLAELRDKNPNDWHDVAGVDHKTGERLIMMATGVEVR